MRHLPDALKTYLDTHIQHDDGPQSPRSTLLAAARACVGITESGGDNRGPYVEMIQAAVSRPMAQSWCLDFVQACIAYAELIHGVSCPLPAIEHVVTLWDQARGGSSVAVPQPGDIILWNFAGTTKGHCGIVAGIDVLCYQTIEGNTGPGHEIEREGDGVYLKNRAKGGSKSFIQLGFLKCFQ